MPPLDLLQGEFAIRKRAAAPGMTHRAAVYAALTALFLLAAGIIDGFRHDQGAEALAATVTARAEAAGIAIPADSDPLPALRLAAAERGAGGGFSPSAQALFAAVRSAPGISIASMEWTGGRLLADLSMQAGTGAEALLPSIEAAGYRLISGAAETTANGLRTSIEVVP